MKRTVALFSILLMVSLMAACGGQDEKIVENETMFETYSTGAKAPANWIEGTYPEGEAEYPVNDVSYEDAIECEKSEVMSTKASLHFFVYQKIAL